MAGMLKYIAGGALAGMGKGLQEDIKARRDAALESLREGRADARQANQLQAQKDMNRDDNTAQDGRVQKQIDAENTRAGTKLEFDKERAKAEDARADKDRGSRETIGMLAYQDEFTDEGGNMFVRRGNKAEPVTGPDGQQLKGPKKAGPAEKVYAKEIGEAITANTPLGGATDWAKVEQNLRLAKIPYDPQILADIKSSVDAMPAADKEEPGWLDSVIGGDDGEKPGDYEGQQAIPLPASADDLVKGTKYVNAQGRMAVWDGSKLVPVQ